MVFAAKAIVACPLGTNLLLNNLCLFVFEYAISAKIAIIVIIIVANAKCVGEFATFCINAIPISLIFSKNKKYATIIAFIVVITTPPAATSLAIFAFG